jgi:hypothetical protein
VSGHDAFDREMGVPNRIGDQEVERLLSRAGAAVETTDEKRELASFVTALRVAVREQPDRDVEASLVPRLATVARSANERAAAESTVVLTPLRAEERGAAWRRLALFARVAVAAVLVPALLAGLAFAGVTLPQPAQDAFERLGIDLPNQSAVDDGQAGDGETRGSDQATAAQDKRDETQDEAGDAAGAAGAGTGAQHAAGHPNGGPGKAKAKGHDKDHGKPEGAGPSGGTPPGQGATPPGQGGVPPGNGGVPPGSETAPPSGSNAPSTTPGSGGVPPGQGAVPPGQDK